MGKTDWMAMLDIYVLTFNCCRTLLEPLSLSQNIFNALPSPQNSSALPDIIVLSLQEVAPIAYAFLGGSYLVPYFARFRAALHDALLAYGEEVVPYENILTRNVGMTAIMVFAKPEIVNRIRDMQTGGVGVGLWEMGNKGAVGVRLGLALGEEDEETDLTFVAAHLAPMENGLERRNLDWENITRGLVFQPTSRSESHPEGAGDEAEDEPLLFATNSLKRSSNIGIYHPKTHLFVAGDLNYRTRNTSPSPTDYTTYPQPTKDPSSPLHWSRLLPSDQLVQELHAKHTLHGLAEAPIPFPPTYKYSHSPASPLNHSDVPEATETWHWAHHRAPSWCDRILFLPQRAVTVHGYTSLPLLRTSDHMPVALSLKLDPRASANLAEEDDVRTHPPFAINPGWKAARAAARRRELVVGVIAYLGLTWEGRAVLLAMTVGGLGGWVVLRALVAG